MSRVEHVFPPLAPYCGTCEICFEENVELLKFSPCYHICCCAKCFFGLQGWNGIMKDSKSNCPLCRTAIKRAFFTGTLESKLQYAFSDSFILFSSISTMITCAPQSSTPEDLINMLVHCWKVCKEQMDEQHLTKLPLLTDSEAKSVLQQLKCKFGSDLDDDAIQRWLLSLCRTPWNLKHFNGSAVCYNGYFGEEPSEIYFALNYIRANMQKYCKLNK